MFHLIYGGALLMAAISVFDCVRGRDELKKENKQLRDDLHRQWLNTNASINYLANEIRKGKKKDVV